MQEAQNNSIATHLPHSYATLSKVFFRIFSPSLLSSPELPTIKAHQLTIDLSVMRSARAISRSLTKRYTFIMVKLSCSRTMRQSRLIA